MKSTNTIGITLASNGVLTMPLKLSGNLPVRLVVLKLQAQVILESRSGLSATTAIKEGISGTHSRKMYFHPSR